MHPDANTALEFYFLEQAIPDMQGELPAYLAAAEGVSPQTSKYWNGEELPHWAAACQQVLLCQPSSAAVKRVISVLRSSSFGDDQDSR